jgi:hypothetical protein
MTDTTLIKQESELIILGLARIGVLTIDPNDGKIWRCAEGKPDGTWKRCRRRRAEHARRDGYLRIRATVQGVRHQVSAHRVIWMAVHGLIPEGYTIDHINGRRNDNRVANLEAVPHAVNVARAVKRKRNRR